MSKPTDSRPYFRAERWDRQIVNMYGATITLPRWQIVSIAGGDIVADDIPSADLAEAARKGMEDARK